MLAQKAHLLQLRPDEVPARFADVTIEGIGRALFQRMAKRYLAEFWTHAPAGRAPALFGRAGTYKTYTACVIAHTVRTKALVDVAFADGAEFLLLENDRYDRRGKDRLAWITNAPFLVLDDITHVRPATLAADMLEGVVHARYASQLPTLFTGNVAPKADDWTELTNQFSAGFVRRVQEGARGLIAVFP